MDASEAKSFVLGKYPKAWVYRPAANFPIGIHGSTWTIMKEVGCVPSMENALGPSSISGEAGAWLYAAERIASVDTPIDEPLPPKQIIQDGYNHTKHGNSCLMKCGDDEPIFVIRAQDKSAAGIVQMWLVANPHISPEKRAEALDCQRAMIEWPKKKKAD